MAKLFSNMFAQSDCGGLVKIRLFKKRTGIQTKTFAEFKFWL